MFQLSKNRSKINPALSREIKGENNIIKTPSWLAKYIFKLTHDYYINIWKHGEYSILDPCCGQNMVLSRLFFSNDKFTTTCFDKRINQGMDFFKYPKDNKFKIIISNPPFTKDIEGKNINDWVEKILIHLCKNDGVAFVIVPDYFLYNGEKRKQYLNEKLFYVGCLPKMTFGFPLHTFLIGLSHHQNKIRTHFEYIFKPDNQGELF